MNLFITGENVSSLEGYIFCDNDFLSVLSEDVNILTEIISIFSDKLFLDPFTIMEFLRNVYLPEHLKIKQGIVDKVFQQVDKNQEILTKITDKAMDLSRLYAHANEGKGASIVDLLLAGRMAVAKYKIYLVTGNAKDFPSCIFDTVSVINFEQTDGTMRAISIKSFNKQKFDKATEKYEKMLTSTKKH